MKTPVTGIHNMMPFQCKGARNVWLDHNTFDDGTHPDAQNGTYFGREYQHHDGDTDLTNGADNITVSDNIYRNHDKTMLIGNSDTKKTDAGKLHDGHP